MTIDVYGEKGGKGGGSDRAPEERPNTLRSRSTARLIDVISEGPTVGIVGGLNGIYLDKTPLAQEDGTRNFDGIATYERKGGPNQTYIPGFSTAENEVAVGQAVTNAIPVLRTVTDGELDAVRIKLRVAQLTRVLDKDNSRGAEAGDIVGAGVDLKITITGQQNGSNATVRNVRIEGKTTSAYERALTFRLPKAGNTSWQIKVERVTADRDELKFSDTIEFSSYTEIIYAKLIYPDTALVGIEVDAEQFGGQVPERLYRYKGLKTQIPSNYDPVTATYTGIWDGSFKLDYHNNPAWVFYALATDKVFGLGDFIPAESVDKFALYQIGKYCDELVPDGKGGTERRMTFNGVMNSQMEAAQALDALASMFRGMVFWGAGAVVPVQDAPGPVVKIVSPANVIGGEFTYTGSPLSSRHSSVAVSWNDPDDFGKASVEIVQNDKLIQRFGERQKQISLLGCTSRGQAQRAADWLLYTEEYESETVTYRASLDHATVRPGQIIEIADPDFAGARCGGRIKEVVSPGVFILDEFDAAVLGNSKTISFFKPYGAVQKYPISSIQGNQVTLTIDADYADPMNGTMWLAAGNDLQPRTFRVISNIEKSPNEYEITALLYLRAKYDYVERDKEIPETNYVTLPKGAITGPSNLRVTQNWRPDPGSVRKLNLTISFTASFDPRVQKYKVLMALPNESFKQIGSGTNTSYDTVLDKALEGTYKFRVVAIAKDGQRAKIDLDQILDLSPPPEIPANWNGKSGHDSITLYGDEAPESDFRSFVIYGATALDTTLYRLGETPSNSFVRQIPRDDAYTRYKVSTLLHSGVESGKTPFIGVVKSPSRLEDLDAEVAATIQAAQDKADAAGLEVAQAQLRIDDVDGHANALQIDVDATIARVTDTETDISSLNTSTAQARTDIDAARVDLNAATSDITVIQQNATALTARVGTAESAITTEETARVDADVAISGSVDTVRASLNAARFSRSVDFSKDNPNAVNAFDWGLGSAGVVSTSTEATLLNKSVLTITADASNDAILGYDLVNEGAHKTGVTTVRVRALMKFTGATTPTISAVSQASDTVDSVTTDYSGAGVVFPAAANVWVPVEVVATIPSAKVLRKVNIKATNVASGGTVVFGDVIFDETTEQVETEALITNESIARADADSALTSSVNSLTSRMGTAEADITSESTTRANADSALTNSVNSLTSRMGTAEADITSESTTRANADSALTNSVNSLTSRMGTAEADITSEATTRADADSALTTSVNSLTTRMGTAESDITNESAARVSADDAIAFDVTTLSSTLANDYQTSASIASTYFTKAAANTSESSIRSDLNASINGVSADLTTLDSAFATNDGKVRAFKGISATTESVGGVTRAASFKLTSYADPDGSGGSAITLNAENIIANGTLSAEKLIVGLGGNLMGNTNYTQGLTTWSLGFNGGMSNGAIKGLRGPDLSYAGKNYPTLYLRQPSTNTATDGYMEWRYVDTNSSKGINYQSVPVTPNKWYEISAAMATIRCNAELGGYFYDINGTLIQSFSINQGALGTAGGGSNNPDSWARQAIFRQAPAAAAYFMPFFRMAGTDGTANDKWLFIHKPMMCETTEFATQPSPYKTGVSTLIDGDGIYTNAITSRHITAGTVTAASAIIANAAVGTLEVAGNAITAATYAVNPNRIIPLSEARACVMVTPRTSGFQTELTFTCDIECTSQGANTQIKFTMQRDGSTFEEVNIDIGTANKDGSFLNIGPVAFRAIDKNTGGGNTTYEVKCTRANTSGWTINMNNIDFSANQFKR